MTISPTSSWMRSFGIFWTGQALSLFGSALVQFALVWYLTETTGSATILAMASLAAVLPNVCLAPLTGVLVDRWNRRVILIVSDGLVALTTVALAILFAAGAVQVWHVFAVLLIRGAAGTFQFPAAQASTSLMVPEVHLARVAGFNQMLHGAFNIAAPPLGALLLGVLPMQGVLAVDVVTGLMAVVSLLVLAVPQPPRSENRGSAPSFWSDMRAGFHYTWSWTGLMALLVMATAVNFFLIAALSLMPILVTRHFGGNAMQLAAMGSIFGIGAVVGGIALGVWGGFHRRIFTSLTGLIGIGVGFLLLGVTPSSMFPLAVAATMLAAVMVPIANGPIIAVLQASVDPGMQGRVLTLMGSIAGAISPIGLVIAGPVSDALGVRVWYMAGGVVCMGMGVLGFFIPAVARIEEHHGASGTPVAVPEPAARATTV